jgi:glycerophosphoryl diester phosphodiesterase
MGLYLVGIVLFSFGLLHLVLRPRPALPPFTIAHRGAAGLAPENTIRALRVAARQGAAYAEIDVRRASDGVLVVIHDRALNRATGRAADVEQLSSGEITRLKVRSRIATSASGVRVPSLDAALKSVAGRAIRLVIEVKEPARYPGIEQQLIESVQRTGAHQRVIVASFDHAWLTRLSALAPDVAIMPFASWFSRVPVTPMTRLAGVWWFSVILDPTLVQRVHRQGCQVEAWTVDNAWLMKLLFWLGVDGITTNRPDLCQKLINRTRTTGRAATGAR